LLTVLTTLEVSGQRQDTSTVSSKVQSLVVYRSKRQQDLSCQSISKPPKPSVSPFRQPSLPMGATDPSYLPTVRKAIEEAHGHAIRTLNGRVVSIEGPPAPKNVAIVEWDSVNDAVAFYKSKAWTDLAPQRDKAQKTIRRYVVEVEK
jgi:uncharacterized protein (DUF1330 family)